MKDKPVVFISHASEEQGFALPVKDWIDDHLLGAVNLFASSDKGESIPLGSEWFKRIKDSLEGASIILVLVSENSNDRRWIYFEAGAGFVRNIPVIPICIGSLRKESLPSPLNSLQSIEIENDDEKKQLLNIIAKSAGLKTPRIIGELKLPKLISQSNKKINEINVDSSQGLSFKENLYVSQLIVRVVELFQNSITEQDMLTISEIEKNIKKQGEKKRRFLVIALELLLSERILEKQNVGKSSYWKLTNEGGKFLKGLA